jgi:sulfur-oxidizing protein SoxZ
MQRPRIRLPDSARVGEVIEIKTLINHVMETGQRRESDGKLIPRMIVHSFTASFAGAEVFRAELHPGIAANPYLVFFLRVPGPGELELTWSDDSGASISEKVRLNVVA